MRRIAYLMIASLLVGFSAAPVAKAALSASNITSTKVWVHGIYTSDDDTCRTNLVPTMPIVKDPVQTDLASTPLLASGPVAEPVRCVVVLIANRVDLTYKPGPYATPDNECDAGGTISTPLCNGTTPAFSAGSIKDDILAAGLGFHQGVCNGQVSNIIPLTFSTLSRCKGNAVLDAGDANCSGSTINPFSFPSFGTGTNGIRIGENVAIAKSFKFAINPNLALAGNTVEKRCEPSGTGFTYSFTTH